MKAGDSLVGILSWERAQVRTRGKDPSRHTAVRVYRVGGGSSSPDGRPCSAELPLSCSFDAAPHDRGKERGRELGAEVNSLFFEAHHPPSCYALAFL